MPISDLLSASGALVLVVALILLLRFGARFLHARRPAGGARLSIAAQIGLDGKRRLQLVQCDGRLLLVLTGGSGDQMLFCPPASAPCAAGECR